MTIKEKTITLDLHQDSLFYKHNNAPLRLLATFESEQQDIHHTVVVYRHGQLGFGASTLNNVSETKVEKQDRKSTPDAISEFIANNPDLIGSTRVVSAAPASIYHPLDKERVTIINVTCDTKDNNPVPILVFFHSQHGFGALYHYGLKEI